MLSPEEKGFVRTLQEDGRWNSIMRKLRKHNVTPYKEGKNFEDWIFESGQVRENRRIFEILSGDFDE